MQSHQHSQTRKLKATIETKIRTVKTIINIHTMPVVQPLERPRQIYVEVKVRRVLLLADAREVAEEVFVHARGEGLGRAELVVDGGVEGEGFVDDVDDLGVCYMWSGGKGEVGM